MISLSESYNLQNMRGNTIIAFNKFDSNVNIQNIINILNFMYALVLQGKHLERGVTVKTDRQHFRYFLLSRCSHLDPCPCPLFIDC